MNLRWIESVERYADHRSAPWLLGAISFASSSFLPVAPDVLLVPMVLLQPARLSALTLQCIVWTTLGALLGYAIGAEAWNAVGQQLIQLYGWTHEFNVFTAAFTKWGVWIIIAKALTPIPFKFAAIAAGVAKMNLVTFTVASFASRALHFVLVAVFLRWCGARMMDVIAKYETRAALAALVAIAACVLVYVGFKA